MRDPEVATPNPPLNVALLLMKFVMVKKAIESAFAKTTPPLKAELFTYVFY